MKIPFVDMKAQYHAIKRELDEAYSRVMESGTYILGEEVAHFEKEYAQYCETSYCVGTSNGLDALHLLLVAYGLTEGDEVIVPAHTFIATYLAVSAVGATIIPVDVDEITYNIDIQQVESAISSRTKAIMAVDLYGMPADFDRLRAVAERHGLPLIEDAAQAHGARYKGHRAGSDTDAAGFSFYPVKNLGAFGDGGAIVTNDHKVAQACRKLLNYGSVHKYVHEVRGHNKRLDELQAALLRVKLIRLDDWNERRRTLASRYIKGIDAHRVILPKTPDYAEHVWHLFVIRHPRRDELADHLRERGVATMIHYPIPPYAAKAYVGKFSDRAFPKADRIAREILSLPMHPFLREQDVDYICQAVNMFDRE